MIINIRLSENINKDFEDSIRLRINNALFDSPLKHLEIEKVFVTDGSTAQEIMNDISPSHSYTNNEHTFGVGKSIGLARDNSIINYLFYDIKLFINLNNNRLNKKEQDVYNYVFHHEFGHCIDHNTRKEIIPPQIRNGVIFNKKLSDNYYLYMLKGELSACYFSNYAANSNLIEHQLYSLEFIYNRFFSDTKQCKLILDIYNDNDIARYNLHASFAELCWSTLVEFSKIIGYRIGNTSLANHSLLRPRRFPQSLYNKLMVIESDINIFWKEYPSFTNSFDEYLISISEEIAILLRPYFNI